MIPKVCIYIEDFVNCVQDFSTKIYVPSQCSSNRTKFDSFDLEKFDLYLFLYNRKTTSKYIEALQNVHMYNNNN